MKTLLSALLTLGLLAGCAQLKPALNHYGHDYCAHPEAERAQLRAQLDAITDGFQVRIHCAGDADAPSGQ